MTELGVAEWALPATNLKRCSRRSLPPQAPPGSVSFLPEGMPAEKAPRSSLSGPLEAAKSWGVICAASPV